MNQNQEVSIQNMMSAVTDTIQSIAGSVKPDEFSMESATSLIGDTTAVMLENLSHLPGMQDIADPETVSNQATHAALLQVANPDMYGRSRREMSMESSGLDALATGQGGPLDYIDVSMESFDTNALGSYQAHTVMIAASAARQTELAEAFFRTKVLPAGQTGVTVSVTQEIVHEYVERVAGQLTDLRERLLIDAYTDHTVLDQKATKVVPFANPDGSVDQYFISKDFVDNTDVVVDNTTVSTRPLKFGVKMDLLSLGIIPGSGENSNSNISDQLAQGGHLDNVYMIMDNGTDTKETIRFDVAGLGRTQFLPSQDGDSRDMQIQFITTSLVIDKNTVNTAGNIPTLLKTEIADKDLLVTLRLEVTGRLNLNSGELRLNQTAVEVETVRDNAGQEISLASGAGKAIVDKLEAVSAKFEAFDLDQYRSNSNWRNTGVLVDVRTRTQSYTIRPGSPLSVIAPTGVDTVQQKLTALGNAARARNTNQAITTLVNYAGHLKIAEEAMKRGVNIEIVGAARYLVNPTYVYKNINMLERIKNRNSAEKYDDVRAVLVDPMREAISRVARDSNYTIALDNQNGGRPTKPTVIIGTDAHIAGFLDIKGESDLLGPNFDCKVYTDNDSRLKNKIFMTFTTEKPAMDDVLSFGTFMYSAEAIRSGERQRDNTTVKLQQITPTGIHVPNLPILVEFDVTNLEEAINTKIAG